MNNKKHKNGCVKALQNMLNHAIIVVVIIVVVVVYPCTESTLSLSAALPVEDGRDVCALQM